MYLMAFNKLRHRLALKTFFLAMVMFPEVQKIAQQEIDSVLHGKRLPDFDDMSSLPYVTALVMEVQRWHPALPKSVSLEHDAPGLCINWISNILSRTVVFQGSLQKMISSMAISFLKAV
jgi:hypothetical protein